MDAAKCQVHLPALWVVRLCFSFVLKASFVLKDVALPSSTEEGPSRRAPFSDILLVDLLGGLCPLV